MLIKKSPDGMNSLLSLVAEPIYGFLLALIIYFCVVMIGGSPFRMNECGYFNYLADAFLHGQLSLRLIPATTVDLSVYNENYYLYWPPMPAVILMPFVALFGVRFSDFFFNILVASLNVGLVALLLREADLRKLVKLNDAFRGLLVVFFAFGTVHIIVAIAGGVWFTAQLLGFLFVGLAYISAMKFTGLKAFFVTGLCMACATLTRNHLLFTGIWPAYYLIVQHWRDRSKLPLYITIALLPLLVFGSLFLFYNYLRFGAPFDLGIRYHQVSLYFWEDYRRYGAFNIHYVPINLYYQYIFYPLPFTEESFNGGSLFLLSPIFFYAFRGLSRDYRSWHAILWSVSIVITSIPILLLMGTGWVQYGPRYTLDFTIPLLLLTGAGLGSSYSRFTVWFVVASIVQYLPGVISFSLS